MSIELYTFETADGEPAGTFSTQSAREAQEYASRHGYRVIAHRYEHVDSELVEQWDFTS